MLNYTLVIDSTDAADNNEVDRTYKMF